ncbi:MAG TPA: DUF4175 family protein [Planctomycetaceae bacterium]|nr:DUF4175 family protein [Planctomycetaceae bacterium]
MSTAAALVERIGLVRRRARLTVCLRGIAWLVAITGGLLVLAGLADRIVHFDDPTLRLGLLAGIVVATAAAAWRLVVAPLVVPLSDLALALRIEERFPGFEERLASSLQFQGSDRAAVFGSPDLQERVIAETLERANRLDFRDVVRFSYVRTGAIAAAFTVLLAAGLAWHSPGDAAVAFRRLFVPYSAPAWPRSTNLRLLTVDFQPIDPRTDSPLKVVRGRKLELLVEDRQGRLPDDVTLAYRLPDEPVLRETLRHASLRDRTGTVHDVCLVSLPADRGPVWFRALGGDDETMPELEMRVVLPPVLETLKLTLTPPRYTARPVTALPPGEGRIRGVVGTQVAFEARSSKPLASAAVAIKGKTAGTTTILPDRQAFRGTFVLAEPGAYAYTFQLKDSEGIENANPPRYEIEAAADQIPEVTIDVPPADTTVTADAHVPVTVSAKDDWGLRELRLRIHVGDNAEARATTLSLANELPRPEHQRVSIVWPLDGLAVSEGMRIVFHAEAADWFDLGPAHVGKSAPRILTVVSAKQKDAEIVSRQADLLRLLERAEQAQSQTREQTGDLNVQLDKAGQLRPSDVDVLKRVQADQRRVNDVLASPADGAAAAVRGLLDEMRQNHIASPQTRQRLERFDRELSELGQSHLAAVDNHLTRAVKTADLPTPAPHGAAQAEQSKSLKSARREQGIVLESLRTMLGDLAQWRDSQGIREGLRELVEAQDKLNGETADLSRVTLAKPLSELAKQEQADLARLAERQSQLAEQVERIGQRLREAAHGLQASNRDAAQDAAATLKSLQRADPQSRMREIGSELSQNNVGQAMAQQHQLLDELRKLDRTFSQRPENDLQSLVARMTEAGQKIESLRKDQESLRKRTEQHAKRNDSKSDPELEALRKEQNRLAEGAEETARELRRLGAEAPTESLRQAGSRMSQAEEQLQRGRSASAGAQQKQAVDELDRATAALRQSKKQATQQLAQQSLVRVADELAGLAARQKTVVDETKRLDSERAQAARWTRGQLRSLQSAAGIEHQLRDETARIADRLQNADVYAWVLRRGAGEMQQAADRLKTQLTDAKTIALEVDAWSRLRDLAQLLKPDNSSTADQAQKEESSGGSSPSEGDGIPLIAQLKLLKTLEQNILRRTGELDQQRRANAGNTDSSRAATDAELDRLAAEQGELATLIRQLVSQAAGASEQGKPSPSSKDR